MAANPLDASEREEIRCGLDRAQAVTVIAQRLGRARSTISREISRNGGKSRYRAVAAQQRAGLQRRRPKTPKLVADAALCRHVTRRLEARDSPMTISIELARGLRGPAGSTISHETIYQAIYRPDRGLAPRAHTGLHLQRRRRKPRRSKPPGSHSLGTFTSIHDRPRVAETRTQVGHLEGDLICGAFNRSAIITIFDRASRRCWLAGLGTGTRKDATYQALVRTLRRIPEPCRLTLTWDQGSEMARHHDLAQTVGIDIYIADPHAPWQRPTNENGNALIRRYVGKGTNLATWTPRQLRTIEHRINTTPRRSLNWATAHDTYHQHVAMTE